MYCVGNDFRLTSIAAESGVWAGGFAYRCGAAGVISAAFVHGDVRKVAKVREINIL